MVIEKTFWEKHRFLRREKRLLFLSKEVDKALKLFLILARVLLFLLPGKLRAV